MFGVEGDGDWANASGFGTFTATSLCAAGCLTKNTWLSTARGRVGYAFDRYLCMPPPAPPLAMSGQTSPTAPISSSTESGWTVGAGIEVALGRNWSAKARIPLCRPCRWILHDSLRHRQCKWAGAYSQRRGKVRREHCPRRRELQIRTVGGFLDGLCGKGADVAVGSNRYRSLRTENRTMSVVPRKRRKFRTYRDQRTAGHGSHLGQISDRPAMTLGSPLVRFAASPLTTLAARAGNECRGFCESRAAPYPA